MFHPENPRKFSTSPHTKPPRPWSINDFFTVMQKTFVCGIKSSPPGVEKLQISIIFKIELSFRLSSFLLNEKLKLFHECDFCCCCCATLNCNLHFVSQIMHFLLHNSRASQFTNVLWRWGDEGVQRKFPKLLSVSKSPDETSRTSISKSHLSCTLMNANCSLFS